MLVGLGPHALAAGVGGGRESVSECVCVCPCIYTLRAHISLSLSTHTHKRVPAMDVVVIRAKDCLPGVGVEEVPVSLLAVPAVLEAVLLMELGEQCFARWFLLWWPHGLLLYSQRLTEWLGAKGAVPDACERKIPFSSNFSSNQACFIAYYAAAECFNCSCVVSTHIKNITTSIKW